MYIAYLLLSHKDPVWMLGLFSNLEENEFTLGYGANPKNPTFLCPTSGWHEWWAEIWSYNQDVTVSCTEYTFDYEEEPEDQVTIKKEVEREEEVAIRRGGVGGEICGEMFNEELQTGCFALVDGKCEIKNPNCVQIDCLQANWWGK